MRMYITKICIRASTNILFFYSIITIIIISIGCYCCCCRRFFPLFRWVFLSLWMCASMRRTIFSHLSYPYTSHACAHYRSRNFYTLWWNHSIYRNHIECITGDNQKLEPRYSTHLVSFDIIYICEPQYNGARDGASTKIKYKLIYYIYSSEGFPSRLLSIIVYLYHWCIKNGLWTGKTNWHTHTLSLHSELMCFIIIQFFSSLCCYSRSCCCRC